MAWEQRNGNRYYYRKRRQGRQVISEYVGGPVAELLAELDRDEHEERLSRRECWNKQKEEVTQVEKQIVCSSVLIHAIIQAHLLMAGYHPHKGQWRKMRDGR